MERTKKAQRRKVGHQKDNGEDPETTIADARFVQKRTRKYNAIIVNKSTQISRDHDGVKTRKPEVSKQNRSIRAIWF
jgi:hypothetical protein